MASGSSSKMQRASTAAREGGMVTIKIGDDGTDYQVHQALLMEHSEYFQKALNGPWKEAQEGVVRLNDVSCENFDIFVDWVYTGKLSIRGVDCENWFREEDAYDAMEHTAVPLCAFAYRILASGFHKVVEHAIIRNWLEQDFPPNYATVITAFATLPSKSPVLRLLVDTQCEWFREEYDDDDDEEIELRAQLPNEFLVRVMLRYSSVLKDRPRKDLDACDYHNHQSEEEREECKE